MHLSFQSIDDSAPAGLGGATSSRYKAHVKEYNRAYGTCEALEEILMSFFVMCFAHSDSWRLMRKKKKCRKCSEHSTPLIRGPASRRVRREW